MLAKQAALPDFGTRTIEWARTLKPSTVLIVALILVITANETQRITAQWQSHQERQAQTYLMQANGLKLDKVIAQDDLQLQLLTRHSTDLERLTFAAKEKEILLRSRR